MANFMTNLMTNLVAILFLALCLGAAIRYIVRQKKRGAKCIGCSMAGECPHRRSGCDGAKDAAKKP